ncbi:MAG: hypothetical protein IKW89_03660 [Bacteroidales bacterium]|nr:hypothetical protein [Bacteroidales bacterium]
MFFKNTLTGLAFLFSIAACTIVDTELSDPDSGFENEIVFSASSFKSDESLATRTSIVNGGGFIWSANDTVGIYPNSGSQVFFAMESGAGASAYGAASGWSELLSYFELYTQ